MSQRPYNVALSAGKAMRYAMQLFYYTIISSKIYLGQYTLASCGVCGLI